MSKHTPGPWRTTRFTGNKSWTIQRSDTHEALASVRTGEANARLIAAAPEMLEALKEARGWIELAEDMCRDTSAALSKIDALIAKAEGIQ